MPEAVKILGQQSPAANTDANLYTTPANTRTVMSSLVICNTTAAAIAVRVHARPLGAAAAPGNALVYDLSIAPNDSVPLTWGIALGPTDVVSVRAAAIGVTFTAFGSEVT